MEFEFDPAKSDSNKKKHGMDFIDAQALWNDPDFIEIPVRTIDEARLLVIGKISEKTLVGNHYVQERKGSYHLCTTIQRRGD